MDLPAIPSQMSGVLSTWHGRPVKKGTVHTWQPIISSREGPLPRFHSNGPAKQTVSKSQSSNIHKKDVSIIDLQIPHRKSADDRSKKGLLGRRLPPLLSEEPLVKPNLGISGSGACAETYKSTNKPKHPKKPDITKSLHNYETQSQYGRDPYFSPRNSEPDSDVTSTALMESRGVAQVCINSWGDVNKSHSPGDIDDYNIINVTSPDIISGEHYICDRKIESVIKDYVHTPGRRAKSKDAGRKLGDVVSSEYMKNLLQIEQPIKLENYHNVYLHNSD